MITDPEVLRDVLRIGAVTEFTPEYIDWFFRRGRKPKWVGPKTRLVAAPLK
jgi:hypothetical protein